jgi:hypothetical protein
VLSFIGGHTQLSCKVGCPLYWWFHDYGIRGRTQTSSAAWPATNGVIGEGMQDIERLLAIERAELLLSRALSK